MTNPLTAAEIAEAKALEAAATPGEWFQWLDSDIRTKRLGENDDTPVRITVRDLRFIAASRSLVPRLLAENEALRADSANKVVRCCNCEASVRLYAALEAENEALKAALREVVSSREVWLSALALPAHVLNRHDLRAERSIRYDNAIDRARALLAEGSATAGEGSGA